MRLTGIHVDGYGSLANLDLEGLAPTLSVVYGLNEAGKSTLLDFIRAVLFGFPNRRSRQNQRAPLRGGRHGGTLRLLDEDGRPWVIERHSDLRDPVLTGPDGRFGGEVELRALVGGANAGLFRSIFAFGLDELTSLDTLDDDDVRDLVFTAGVLGAGRSATRAMRELEDRQAGIVRQRSPDARANQLRRKLDEVDSLLRETRSAAEGYVSAQAEYRRLCTQTEAARRHLEELRNRGGELDRLRTCWPMWNRVRESEAGLAALGPPDQAAERIVERAAEIRSLDAERSAHALRLTSLGQLRTELDGIERSRRELTENNAPAWPESAPPKDKPYNTDRPRALPRDEAELRSAERTVQLLRGLIGQRDQLLATQREQMTMERFALRHSPDAARSKVAVTLLVTALLASMAVATVEFSTHHAPLGAVSAAVALALLVAATFLVVGTRSRPSVARPEVPEASLTPVDPQRLATEIARVADALGLTPAPALVEVDTVASRLEEEREDRRRTDELTKLDGAHQRVFQAIDSETATIEAFKEAVRSTAEACGLRAADRAIDTCARLASALDKAEAAVEARQGLVSALDQANSDLAKAAGLGPASDRFREELSSGDLASWDAESESITEQLTVAERDFQGARDRERDLGQSLERLKSSEETAALEVTRASLATQLEDALEEWAVLGLGHRLLEATFARYEREKQPAVIERASELFTDVTAGRYLRLVAHEDERAAHHGIDAISARDERVDSGSLSRGTAEQLYLCLRLGLAATHAERTVSLPFVLDDVLVNFDPGRAAAVAGAIATLARSHQVLAFTCHPHIVEVFQQADPDCTLIELPLEGSTGPRLNS